MITKAVKEFARLIAEIEVAVIKLAVLVAIVIFFHHLLGEIYHP
jgi:hypothetical protein